MTAMWVFVPGSASVATVDGWDPVADVRDGWSGVMSMEIPFAPVLPAGMPPQEGLTMLISYVEDSGFCVLTAGGRVLPHWRWVLNDGPFIGEYPAELVAAYGLTADEAADEGARAARRQRIVPVIAQWAKACGLPEPDSTQLDEILAQKHIRAESGMYELLRTLGIVIPATRPLPREPHVDTAPRKGSVPKTVDGVVGAFAAPVLNAAGFVRNKRDFRTTNDNGDLLALGFQTSRMADGVAFFIEFGLIPDAFRAWRMLTSPEYDGDEYVNGMLRYRITAPADVTPHSEYGPEDRWEFSHHELMQGAGAALTRVLTDEAIPFMSRLLGPGTLIDMLSNPGESRFNTTTRAPYNLLFLLIDEGPSDAFDEVWARLSGWDYFEDRIREWAARRAAERTRERRPDGLLRRLVADRLTPFLASRGFTWSDGAFRKSNAAGDQAIVEIALAHSGTAEDVAFRVDRAVVPKMEWEWLQVAERGWAGSVPQVPDGWCQQRVAPSAGHEFTPGSRDGLDLRLWRVDLFSVEQCGAALETALEKELPLLDALLNREHLLKVVTAGETPNAEEIGPGSPDHEVILLLDKGPSAELDAVFNRIAADSFLASTNEELVKWAKALLG